MFLYKRFILLIIFSLILFLAKSQYYSSYGKVELIKNKKIDELVEKHKQININKKTEGYRIHLFFESGNNARNKAYEIKNSFQEKYPGVQAYVTYRQPNFMVRAGNFRTRLDAEHFSQAIKKDFPSVSIRKVKKISPPPLGKNEEEIEE